MDLAQNIADIGNNKEKVTDFVSSLHTDKIENIRQVIQEISELIQERRQLSNNLIMSCESMLSRINGITTRIPQENIREEIQLQEKAIGVEEVKLNEQLNCWRDIALLKKELREVLREFREQESIQNTYSDLLKD